MTASWAEVLWGRHGTPWHLRLTWVSTAALDSPSQLEPLPFQRLPVTVPACVPWPVEPPRPHTLCILHSWKLALCGQHKGLLPRAVAKLLDYSCCGFWVGSGWARKNKSWRNEFVDSPVEARCPESLSSQGCLSNKFTHILEPAVDGIWPISDWVKAKDSAS